MRYIIIVTPFLRDQKWQVRLATLNALEGIDNPKIDNLVIPILKDNSDIVRQSAITNLGLRVHKNPALINPLTDIIKHDTNTWNKQLAAFSVKTVIESSGKASLNSFIESNIPSIRAVVIIPGVDDIVDLTGKTSRRIDNDWSRGIALRKILELGGLKVIEHRWSGNYRDIESARFSLDDTMLKALDIAGKQNNVMTIMYSAGNWVGERLLSPMLDPGIKSAIDDKRIYIRSLGSPSIADFSRIDPNYKYITLNNDIVTRFSRNIISSGHKIIYSDIAKGIAKAHATYTDPRAISDMVHKAFPYLNMPKLPTMILQQDVSNWKYFPTHGNWPGVYNFSPAIPAWNPWVEYDSGNLRDPFAPQMPGIMHQPGINVPTVPVITPQPVYTPSTGSWPGQYDFNMRAPDNYYQRQMDTPQIPNIPPPPPIPPMPRIDNYRR
ncbi:MAG: HEAT repeat domain-containing protein [Candidatus Omnitrophota bacterium]